MIMNQDKLQSFRKLPGLVLPSIRQLGIVTNNMLELSSGH